MSANNLLFSALILVSALACGSTNSKGRDSDNKLLTPTEKRARAKTKRGIKHSIEFQKALAKEIDHLLYELPRDIEVKGLRQGWINSGGHRYPYKSWSITKDIDNLHYVNKIITSDGYTYFNIVRENLRSRGWFCPIASIPKPEGVSTTDSANVKSALNIWGESFKEQYRNEEYSKTLRKTETGYELTKIWSESSGDEDDSVSELYHASVTEHSKTDFGFTEKWTETFGDMTDLATMRELFCFSDYTVLVNNELPNTIIVFCQLLSGDASERGSVLGTGKVWVLHCELFKHNRSHLRNFVRQLGARRNMPSKLDDN